MKKIRYFFYIIVLVLSIIFIKKIPLNDFKEAFKIIKVKDILFLIFLQIITILLISFSWKLLFIHTNNKIKYIDIIKMNLVGTFYESITPSVKIGGEVFKVLYLKEKNYSATNVTSVTFVQKIISLICFFFLVFISIFLFAKYLSDHMRLIIWISYFILLIIFSFIFLLVKNSYKKNDDYKIKTLNKYKNNINNFKVKFKENLDLFTNKKILFLLHYFIGILIWILYAYKTFYLLNILNINKPFYISAAITFLAYLIAMIPITPGGLGTFEATMVFLLGNIKIPEATSFLIAIIIRFITYWLVFLVSLLYVFIYKIPKIIKNKKNMSNYNEK